MNTACPVCGSSNRKKVKLKACVLSKCIACGHEFTAKSDIYVEEDYGAEYYTITHKKWFENPQIDLFRLIANAVSSKFNSQQGLPVSILDVGCGNGALLAYLATHYPSGHFTGVDTCQFSDANRRTNIHFMNSIFSNKLFTQKFDYIVSTAVIEHIFDVRSFLLEQASLLKHHGRIIVVTMDSNSPVYGLSKFLRLLGLDSAFLRLYSPHHVNHFSRESLSRLCDECGFETVDRAGINVSLKSIDLPESKLIPQFIMQACILFVFALGKVIGRPFLQLVVLSR